MKIDRKRCKSSDDKKPAWKRAKLSIGAASRSLPFWYIHIPKSMKIHENLQRSMKIHDIQKFIEIYKNHTKSIEIQWTSSVTIWKKMETIEKYIMYKNPTHTNSCTVTGIVWGATGPVLGNDHPCPGTIPWCQLSLMSSQEVRGNGSPPIHPNIDSSNAGWVGGRGDQYLPKKS